MQLLGLVGQAKKLLLDVHSEVVHVFLLLMLLLVLVVPAAVCHAHSTYAGFRGLVVVGVSMVMQIAGVRRSD